MSNSVDPGDHNEPSHLDLRCLQKAIVIVCGSERVKRYSINKILTRMGSIISKKIKYNLHYGEVWKDVLRHLIPVAVK